MRTNNVTKAVLATAAAAVVIAGVGVAEASASNTTDDTVVVTAFFETIKPWDSISIPSLSCPPGSYLQSGDWSPGRIVPAGVEVLEPRYGLAPGGDRRDHPDPGPRRGPYRDRGDHVCRDGHRRGWLQRHNWDFAASHDLLIKLHCTTNLDKADVRG